MLELQAVVVAVAAVERLTIDRRMKHCMTAAAAAAAGYIMNLSIVEIAVAEPVAGLLR